MTFIKIYFYLYRIYLTFLLHIQNIEKMRKTYDYIHISLVINNKTV